MRKLELDLHLFDGAAGAGGAGGAAGSGDGGAGGAGGTAGAPAGKAGKAAEPRVVYGRQAERELPGKEPETVTTASTQEDRKTAFERRIKGEDKDLFDERVQRIINERFKNQKALEKDSADLKAAAPILEMLAGKYGVKADDLTGLQQAIEADSSYYEDEALQKGLTVEQLKEIKRLERENAEFKRAAAERERKAAADKIYARWMDQSEDAKRYYPGFDLQTELQAETRDRFLSLLRSGVDVRTAYEVVHKDELIGGAMQYAARVTEKQTVENIRARGARPRENGGGSQASAVIVKKDPRQFTKKDRDEIARRVMRGERIEL